MKALVTGASSGMGRDMARELSARGFELILVARNQAALEELQRTLPKEAQIIAMDLSLPENVFKLYEQVKEQSIDLLINNAGYGIFGEFTQTDLQKELNLIDLNIKAVHILTKLFLRDFVKRDHGFILNVASSAGFLPGPLLSSYYASKSYVLRLSEAIYGELKKRGSKVSISVLCPGPVRTHFDERAGVRFSMKGLSSQYVAHYAITQMFLKKLVIIPGLQMKTVRFLERFVPEKALIQIVFHIQHRKRQ